MKKEGFRRKTTFKKKKGLVWVRPGPLGHWSTEFCWVFTLADLLSYPNRSSHGVPGRSGFYNYGYNDIYPKITINQNH